MASILSIFATPPTTNGGSSPLVDAQVSTCGLNLLENEKAFVSVFTKGVTNGAVTREINRAAHENNHRVAFHASLPSLSQINVFLISLRVPLGCAQMHATSALSLVNLHCKQEETRLKQLIDSREDTWCASVQLHLAIQRCLRGPGVLLFSCLFSVLLTPAS